MEVSTLPRSASLSHPRLAIGPPLLRLRSDEQLVELFRAGSEEAFRAIYDRYQKRLFAYARQMLLGRQDAEDALQDVFVRAYSGLRASDRDLALRAWLFRIAHNRCIDELRKPTPPAPEVLQLVRSTVHDPVVEVDLRESLRRLVLDIRRLPEQQRSALLMRELGGMSYAELSGSLGISVGAVKSLLVRARLALAEASEARDTACAVIRELLVEAHDHGVRPNATARKHMRDCVGCRSFRRELRGVSRQLAAMTPTLGPIGFLANLLGFSGGAGGGGAAGGTGGGAALVGGGGATASAGGLALGANHVALIVAAVATAGGAVEIQHAILPRSHPATVRAAPAHRTHRSEAGALPKRATRDINMPGKAGTTATAAGARAHAKAKPAASRTSGAARTTLNRSSHAGAAVRSHKDKANSSAGTATHGSGLSSTSTPATNGAQLASTCGTVGALGVVGDVGSYSGNAPVSGTANASSTAGSGTSSTGSSGTSSTASSGTSSTTSPGTGSTASTGTGSTASPGTGSTASPGTSSTAGSGTSSTAASTAASCGPSAGSNVGTAPSDGSSTTAGAAASSATNTASTGSGSGSAAVAESSPGASASSSNPATTTG